MDIGSVPAYSLTCIEIFVQSLTATVHWILDPFSSVNTEEFPQLQEELMGVTTNDELKFKFKSGYQQFWLQKEIPTAYSKIWAVIQKFLTHCVHPSH
ncbi:hypothetical protein ANTQUA_LOCUS10040 [Anthophora quadrimaculata]